MSSPVKRRLTYGAYTVALICPLEVEMSAARYMLDEEHERLPKDKRDTNSYILGRLSGHNVVIVSLPEGSQGNVSAATAAIHLAGTFPAIELRLLVGIGGGVPSEKNDIRLGDVVVSTPLGTSGGVIEYDLGKQTPTGFERKGFLCPPPTEWRNVMTSMKSDHRTKSNRIREFLSEMLEKFPQLAEYQRPPPEKDVLFQPDYEHDRKETTCTNCDKSRAVNRRQRAAPGEPVVFYGLIASGNRVMKDAMERDKISKDSGGAICFEMEAAGLMNDFRCVVIRGISDYSDSHKNDEWHAYAAAVAAGLAKEILSYMDPTDDAIDLLGLPPSDSVQTFSPSSVMPRKIEGEQKESAQKAKKLQLLKKLYTSSYRDRKDRNPKRLDGTCEWFINHPLFRNWQESKTSSLLWVSADPGCGKSVLAKYLVDTMLPSTKSRTTCYFFFKDDFEDQRSAASALCCILRQLFMQNDALLSDKVLEKFEADGEKLIGSFRDLWDILINAAADHNAGQIICILDALDECEDKGRFQVAEALRNLYETRRSKLALKFLLTSRPYVHIQQDFQSLKSRLPTIHLSGENEVELEKISREIDIFIKSRVEDIGAKRQLLLEEQRLLQDELIRVPNRTYLWVHLTLDVIENSMYITSGSIRTDTSKIPKTVDEAYDKILCRSRDFEKARRLLYIIVAAARPLSLQEMALALAIKENHRSYGDLEFEPEGRFRNTVRELCGLFVTIIDSKIYLLHQTAKEFLVQKESLDPANPPDHINGHLQWKFSLWPRDSNRILAEICIWHLLFTDFETYPLGVNGDKNQYLNDHIFLDYSAKNWAAHFREAHIRTDSAMIRSVLKICDIHSKSCLTWFKIYWTTTYIKFPEHFTALMTASYFGLERVVKLLLEMDVDLNSTDDTYRRSALSWAAGEGHEAVTKQLLGKGAKADLKAIVKLLFKKGAKANSKDKYGQTPLWQAAGNGHEAVVKLLLEKGAELESKDDIYGQTPLSRAAGNGHEAVVKLLLEKGAEPKSKDNYGQTPLSRAAGNGHEAVVKLLLEKGAEPESKDNYGQAPLWQAAGNGHEAVVKLLLEKGAEPESKDDIYGRTPLSQAAGSGREAVVKLLLEKGAELEPKDKYGQAPLSQAAGSGREAVVKLLLEKGAEPESKDKYGQTPLSWAAGSGREAVVKLLLEKGAEPESRDNDGETPLWRAARNGHEAVVKLLLEKGAELESKDKYGRTPLWRAARSGREAVVKLLLEKGAEPESRDNDGETPLSRAAENRHEAVVKLLTSIT